MRGADIMEEEVAVVEEEPNAGVLAWVEEETHKVCVEETTIETCAEEAYENEETTEEEEKETEEEARNEEEVNATMRVKIPRKKGRGQPRPTVTLAR